MFKKSQHLKGLTVNLVLGLFEQCSRIEIHIGFFYRTNPYGYLSHLTEKNFKITNLDVF